MKLTKGMDLIKKYAICMECGNSDGEVQMLGDAFRRLCPCGWKVEVRVAEKPEVQQMREIQGKPPMTETPPVEIATATLDGKPYDTWIQEVNTEQGG